MSPESIIPSHGGYRELKSFQVAQLVYDLTVRFCEQYVDHRSRTHDQMVQAARSGVQNIAEGSQASGTSKKTEIKLTSVARASLEELRLDYEDFLRQRRLPLWDRKDPRRDDLIARRCTTAEQVAQWIRETKERGGQSGQSGQSGQKDAAASAPSKPPSSQARSTPSTSSTSSTKSTPSTSSTKSPAPTYREIAANAALLLITVACSLLDRQLAAQAAAFQQKGGFTESLYRVRTEARRKPGGERP